MYLQEWTRHAMARGDFWASVAFDGYLPNPDASAGNLAGRKKPFVQRDDSHFSILKGLFWEDAIGNMFSESGHVGHHRA